MRNHVKPAQKPKDEGKVFMQRLQKNLEFFKKRKPAIYKILANMDLQRVELVVTPGRDDVDMVVNGKSCYRGLAKEFSEDEAEKVIQSNPESKRIRTFSPPWENAYRKENFADKILRRIVKSSPVTQRTFNGYIRGNIFPSIVFLGCGLGYHIDALTKRVPVVNGIIIEREPEKFAVSLYTVDWEVICSRFSRKGFSLTFAIGKADEPYDIHHLVSQQLSKDVPFYPFFSTYYNHLADVELAEAVMSNAKDLSLISTHWSNYDNELMRLSNLAHNIRCAGRYLKNKGCKRVSKPLVVVGSGPSLDKRIESLLDSRDKVVIASCGTAIKPLIDKGIKPDFHIELDPSYLVYELLKDIGKKKIQDIPLLAVNEINPFVPSLFDKALFFFKTDNNASSLLGIPGGEFENCNPTVTNSGASIGHALGFDNIYLYGTDFGFENEAESHSRNSVYADQSNPEVVEKVKERVNKKRRVFKTESVDGGTILTKGNLYSAKRSVEELIHRISGSDNVVIFNCSDGANIEGATWLSEEEFRDKMRNEKIKEGFDAKVFLEYFDYELDVASFDRSLIDLSKEVETICKSVAREVKHSRLAGRRDLCTLVNSIRKETTTVRRVNNKGQVSGVQLMARQLLLGSIQHFLHVGLCHGMACEDNDLGGFLKNWEAGFNDFLTHLPRHFNSVMLGNRQLEDDPWALRGVGGPDPELENWQAEIGGGLDVR